MYKWSYLGVSTLFLLHNAADYPKPKREKRPPLNTKVKNACCIFSTPLQDCVVVIMRMDKVTLTYLILRTIKTCSKFFATKFKCVVLFKCYIFANYSIIFHDICSCLSLRPTVSNFKHTDRFLRSFIWTLCH